MPAINLPWPIFVHASGLLIVGLSQTFAPGPPGPITFVSVMMGIFGTALGVVYFTTAYMPVHQNQFLYMTVPIRMFLAILMGVKAFVSRNRLDKTALKQLVTLAIYDGLGGAALGWWLGTWSGRVPNL